VDVLPDFLTTPWGIVAIVVVSLWTLVWKMVALYTAGKTRQKGWFIALFLINTVGVLEILYIGFFAKSEARDAKRRNYRRSTRVHGRRSASNG
jgi:hypothetical protein